jgi:hypothetical protein
VRRRSTIAGLSLSLCALPSGCEGGLPAPEPEPDASPVARVLSDARPDAHFGRDLLFRHRDEAGQAGEAQHAAGAPIAEAAGPLAHDVALWSFTTAGGRLVDVLPIENLALAAIATSGPRAGEAGLADPVSPPDATGLSREAWRLELWRSPGAGEASGSGSAPGSAAPVLLGLQLERALTAEEPVLAPPLAAVAEAADRKIAAGLVLWMDDGSLLVRPLSISLDAAAMGAGLPAGPPDDGALLAGAPRIAYMATDTHRLEGAPVVAAMGSRGYLVCARERAVTDGASSADAAGRDGPRASGGVACATLSPDGEVETWNPIPGLTGHGPRALARATDGFVGLSTGCRDPADCELGPAASFHLDADGQLRPRNGIVQLGSIARHRPITVVETGDGLLVAARKARPDAPGLWHLTADRASPREDAVGRLLGGVHLVPDAGRHADTGEVWLLDASPLVMRDGFPVALPRLARWSPALGRERHVAWPPRISAALPGHRGPPLKARPGFLAFSHAPRADALTVTCLHFAPNGTESSPPEPGPARGKRKKGR